MVATKHIDPDEVGSTFIDCLFRDEEMPPIGAPRDAVVVDGVLHTFGFNKARLESHREEVRAWLALLSPEFHKGGGGGWSFLNACFESGGVQWTGFHLRMEQLLTLGIGLGLAKWSLPREMWAILPGGMPYATIDLGQENVSER